MTKPGLLFYCQHAVGLGHLVRSLALAEGLTADFDVVLLNGGRMPEGARIPEGVHVVDLPPLGYDEAFRLVSHNPRFSVERAKEERRRRILDVFVRFAPRVVLVELFPFGRNKFSFELEPLLDAAHAIRRGRPIVACSLRDILVSRRADQARHDERAVERANAWFDVVLVHADPTFARLEDTFRPSTPLRVPVHYTGFVAGRDGHARGDVQTPLPRVLLSAGGGMVGEPLFRAAVDAHVDVARRLGLTTTVVAGPFLPEPAFAPLQAEAAQSPALEVLRRVDDLCGQMRRSALSVSQCGYNTTLDILRAGRPALVVPYSEGKEDEQLQRAERLAALGALRVLPADGLDGRRLFTELRDLVDFRPAAVDLDLTGSATSTRLLADLARGRVEAGVGSWTTG
jgi:predicted glycosyltransferase